MQPFKLLLGGALAALTLIAHAEIAVIVHPDNELDSISMMDLTRIYLGRMKTFPGGEPAVPINLAPNSPSRKYLESELLHKSPAQMKSYWTKLLFTGEGRPPQEVETAAEAIARVAADKTAIGYVAPSAVTAAVKVLTVKQ